MGRLLVIEDDAEMRVMLEHTLRRAGHAVASAADGKQGLKLHRASPADLVITDLFMPEKEGLETIVELRRDFPELKIIAISGRPGADVLLGIAHRLGAVRTMGKPFHPHELLAAVEEELGSKG